jgi:capsular polysaccharide transport system permease protein
MSDAPTDNRQAAPALRAVETIPAAAPKPEAAAPAAVAPLAKPARAVAKPVRAPAPAPKPAAPVRPRPIPVPPGALPARFRFRHWGLAATFVLAVLLPLAASVWYLFARAADQYHSTTAFSVRSEEAAGAAAGLLGVLTQVGGGSASDTDILFDFIRSQEIVAAIDARLDLRTIYNRAAPRDFYFTLGEDPSIEALLAEWHRMVQVDLESNAGIIHVRAKAFTPEDATAIARAILAESSALVNRLSEQAREDTVRFTRDELAERTASSTRPPTSPARWGCSRRSRASSLRRWSSATSCSPSSARTTSE